MIPKDAKVVPTCAVYEDDNFVTRNQPDWWASISQVQCGGGHYDPWLVIVPAPVGYVVKCFSLHQATHSIVWCPREGDLNSYMMGPALTYLKYIKEEYRQWAQDHTSTLG